MELEFDDLSAEIESTRRKALAVTEEERVKVSSWDLFQASQGNQEWPPIIAEIHQLKDRRGLPYPEARENGAKIGELFWRIGCECPVDVASLSRYIWTKFEIDK